MTEDRHNELLREDWADSWDELPEAPPIIPGRKTAQVTLRLSPSLVERVRRVAELGSMPYHALVRSWLLHAMQQDQAPEGELDAGPHTTQLNIKLDDQVVDALKSRANELRRPYHRLAREWIAAAVAREERRLGVESPEGEPLASQPRSRQAASPYSTGGGGVTFERRVGVLYLAMLLTGDSAAELGADREIRSVAFQQAPSVPVDDMVILAARPEETEPSLELAVGVRRKPNIVKSDSDMQALIVEYLRAIRRRADDRERWLALAVAGTPPHAEQLAQLAALAHNQMDASEFFSLVMTPKKFEKVLRDRLTHLTALVRQALPEIGVNDADDSAVNQHVWELLRRLVVLMHRVEEPDTKDWDNTRRQLRTVAREGSVIAAGHLLDRLESLAGQYAPSAATVDRNLLRRDVHSLLEASRSLTTAAWRLLDDRKRQTTSAVRDHLGSADAGDPLHLDRRSEGEAVMAAAEAGRALIVSGGSGVGKSALVLEAVGAAEAASKGEMQAVFLNLRQLPASSFDLVATLGCSLETVLLEISAPRRLLVIDGADAATESWRDVFSYVVDAAVASDVSLIAVTSTEARQVVHDLIAARLDGQQLAHHTVAGLTDDQLNEVAHAFPQLVRLVENPRSRELLRRLVVVDLLVRSQFSGVPLSDVDAMTQVWAGLVRNHENRDRGLPDAREQTLLRLALRELRQESALELARELDAAAVDGLRQDDLLRASTDNPWQALPQFAHDEVRRYAVARALLAEGDPAAAVLAAGAPRWALPAARLACQAVLGQADRANSPVLGRLSSQQSAFDRVASEHGLRWADVPGEAALTLGDPTPLLADAWSELRANDGTGLTRLLRLVDQRHRDNGAAVDPTVAEPIVALLLNDQTPWRISSESAKLLRDWLVALVVRDTPAGHSLRIQLRGRLLTLYQNAEAEQTRRHDAETAAAVTMTEDEHEQQREDARRNEHLFSTLGVQRRRRRRRREVPREITDDTVLELTALLGLDLGEGGEELLRRVARDAPWDLAPAVEELGTGRALAAYGHGLLADLVEAYYLNDDEDGSGFHEDGIRDHHWRGPVAPLAAWYRGPFGALFQTDFRRGVVVLNRLLNHAARTRIRTLASIGDPWNRITDDEIAAAGFELRVTGQTRTYFGDEHVWLWYRGTGVGPYPCMSALQALERVCDQFVSLGIPLDRLAPILMDGCENLAMPALVVGLLVRHIENAGKLLDPFLAEPVVWQLEFSRAVHESGGLAADSEGLAASERRAWSCREAAMWLALNADLERADALRAVGDQLVARAREMEAAVDPGQDPQDSGDKDGNSPSFTTLAEGWASALDRSRYRAYAEGEQVYVQSAPGAKVEEALRPGNEDLQRGNEVLRIQWRYFAGGARGRAKTPPPVGEDLANDLAIAQDLVTDPPTLSAVSVWEMAAAIAAHALETVVLRDAALSDGAEAFAVNAVLTVAEQTAAASPFDYYGAFFEQGADRLAARALPLLLLPGASELRSLVEHDGDRSRETRIADALERLARAVPNETRVHLARGLDAVWERPCAQGRCHHEPALRLAIESMRDCVLGRWETQQRRIEFLQDPVAESLDAVADADVFVPRLDAGLRALGVAATRQSCVTDRARELLAHVLGAQRRGLLAYDKNFDDRGTHTLEAARALLNLSAVKDDAPLREAIAAYADNGARLGGLLRALAGAAEETAPRAEAARRLWPGIVDQVLTLHAAGHAPFRDRHYGIRALASLMPTPTHDIEFLYREIGTEPIRWTDPLAWEESIDAWLSVAAGDSECVDALIALVLTLAVDDQVGFGLPRVKTLVQGDVDGVARRSFLLSRWLRDIREATVDEGAQSAWQELVDALVVAGDRTLAPYSE